MLTRILVIILNYVFYSESIIVRYLEMTTDLPSFLVKRHNYERGEIIICVFLEITWYFIFWLDLNDLCTYIRFQIKIRNVRVECQLHYYNNVYQS